MPRSPKSVRSPEIPPRGPSLTARAPRYAALLGVAGLAVLATNGQKAETVDELATLLGSSTGTVVRADDVRWEPSEGVLEDFFAGRSLLFLGAERAGGPRDLYRARVRVSPEGRVLELTRAVNLTQTPLGDDHSLVVRGTHAAYATAAFGQEQSVTLLDLGGEGAQNVTQKPADRAMAWVTNLQQTDRGEGIGRFDVTLDQPAARVGLVLGDKGLDIELADDARRPVASRKVRVDYDKGEISPASAPGLHADAARHLPKRLVFWAVDTVRAVPWIGPAPIAWLEEKTFALRDTVKQTAFKVTSGDDALAVEAVAPPSVLDASEAAADTGHWPPSNIRSMWKTPEAGEGEWQPPKQTWVKKIVAGCAGKTEGCEAPPGFYQTFVRPDEERPYAKVLLVAMDMRQFDLEMEAGNEDPKPLTGPPGTGRIPRDPAVYTRIAAAWNGGFKTEHGTYGMMLKKRVLLPPVPGAATVIVTGDARVGMGSWGQNKDVGGIEDVETADIVSFRQNLDPLLDGDKVNPLGRAQWGFTLPGTSMQTERSGICVNAAGHLMYAWGDDVSATTLGKAMKMAGCIYGMHLDMNPHHTGFMFTNITELKGRNYKSELLSTQMEIDTSRYIEYAPKDFFYLTLHDPTPPKLSGDAPVSWEVDPGVQPAPAWMAGLWRGAVQVGGTEVSLLEIEPQRARFRVRAGTKEPDSKTGTSRAHALSSDDAHRVLFALTLGVGDAKRPRGLVTDGRVALPIDVEAKEAALVAAEDGALSIALAGELGGVKADTDVVELPLLFDEEGVASRSSAVHAALGMTPQGRVYIARSRSEAATAESLAKLLRAAGCTRAVILDRGAGGHGALFRAGTETPPRSRYEDTTLYAMGKPLLPRGFRFDAKNPVEPPAPPKKK